MPAHTYNTSVEDRSHFASERARFLIESAKFKLGAITEGIAAVNTLEAMYQVLLAAPHYSKDKDKSAAYTKRICELREEIYTFFSAKGDREYSQEIKDPAFKSILSKFNEVVYEFYKIKAELEMS